MREQDYKDLLEEKRRLEQKHMVQEAIDKRQVNDQTNANTVAEDNRDLFVVAATITAMATIACRIGAGMVVI